MIIAFVSIKGGPGKSTMAINAAVIRAAMGRDVVLVDADKQASAQQWSILRAQDKSLPLMPCFGIHGETLDSQVLALAGRYQDIVIDAGGWDSAELRAALLVADVVVTPSMPSQFDIFSLSTMDQLVGNARQFNKKLRAYVLVNNAPTNPAQTDEADMREYLAEMRNYSTLTTTVKARKAYRTCARDGRAVTELVRGDDKAVAEMMALAAEIWA